MKAEKKKLILDTAEQLMCIMPDKDITVNIIAQNAGIGKGSIYYYFESKDEIINAVIERTYKKALHEYFSVIDSDTSAIDKIKHLFQSIIKPEFKDSRKNMIRTLNLHEDAHLHNRMKLVAINEVSPVLADLFKQGIREGTIHTDTPEESAEMLVSVITFFLDSSLFDFEDEKMKKKMKILGSVLDTCLQAPAGSFDFLYDIKKFH